MYMLAHNRAAAMLLLSRIIADDRSSDGLVLMIADTRDDVGRGLAKAVAPAHGLDAAAEHERVISRGEIPTAIIVIAVEVARAGLAETDPGVARALARLPPPGRVRAIVIAAGGMTLLHLPVEVVVAEGDG